MQSSQIGSGESRSIKARTWFSTAAILSSLPAALAGRSSAAERMRTGADPGTGKHDILPVAGARRTTLDCM